MEKDTAIMKNQETTEWENIFTTHTSDTKPIKNTQSTKTQTRYQGNK